MSGDHNQNQTSPGWRKRQIALDIKAENARELGLDYEPMFTYYQVKAHIQAAMFSEREACAKVVDAIEAKCVADDVDDPPLAHIAAAIRARSGEKK
jgi:hypothetical protein